MQSTGRVDRVKEAAAQMNRLLDASGTEIYVQAALHELENNRIKYVAEDGDRRVIVKIDGEPRVEYFPAKNRWREAGNKKRMHGDVYAFIAWLGAR